MPRPRKPTSPFRYFNSSPEIIHLVVLMYVRFPQPPSGPLSVTASATCRPCRASMSAMPNWMQLPPISRGTSDEPARQSEAAACRLGRRGPASQRISGYRGVGLRFRRSLRRGARHGQASPLALDCQHDAAALWFASLKEMGASGPVSDGLTTPADALVLADCASRDGLRFVALPSPLAANRLAAWIITRRPIRS